MQHPHRGCSGFLRDRRHNNLRLPSPPVHSGGGADRKPLEADDFAVEAGAARADAVTGDATAATSTPEAAPTSAATAAGPSSVRSAADEGGADTGAEVGAARAEAAAGDATAATSALGAGPRKAAAAEAEQSSGSDAAGDGRAARRFEGEADGHSSRCGTGEAGGIFGGHSATCVMAQAPSSRCNSASDKSDPVGRTSIASHSPAGTGGTCASAAVESSSAPLPPLPLWSEDEATEGRGGMTNAASAAVPAAMPGLMVRRGGLLASSASACAAGGGDTECGAEGAAEGDESATREGGRAVAALASRPALAGGEYNDESAGTPAAAAGCGDTARRRLGAEPELSPRQSRRSTRNTRSSSSESSSDTATPGVAIARNIRAT
eukprot:CAMPEP_0183607372 /NCGR_PEP_ID=MMETSP0371-20130417/183428_1 /TAXON_ID=268820 /ORGANISM="Peridinium aciculiferum, Strain PAER-2" /LENGTH=378 /DNA_ID=CAMNT_0025819495 /DNA_START=104 /DNA_END=1238 /DNA_ORIENTATION=+